MTVTDSPGQRFPVARYLGSFFLVAAGINIGLVVADDTIYRAFADQAILPGVRSGWREVVMARPSAWIGLLAAGEIAIGLAFLSRPAWRRVAYLAALAFHLALMTFGWGFWMWCVPASAGLLAAAHHDGVLGRTPRPQRGPGLSRDHRDERWNAQ